MTQVGFSFSGVPSSGNLGNGLEQRPRSVEQARSGALVPPSDAATTPYSRGLKPEARNCGRRQPGRSDVRTLDFCSGGAIFMFRSKISGRTQYLRNKSQIA